MRNVLLALGVTFCTAATTAAPRADLAGRWLPPTPSGTPTCWSPRFTGSLRIELRNQGPASAGFSSGLVFEDLDADGRVSTGDIVVGTAALPALAACERAVVNVPLDVPLSFAGSPLRVSLDHADAIAEVLESNNIVDALDECRERGPVSFELIEKWRYEPVDPVMNCSRLKFVMNTVFIAQTSDDNGDAKIDDDDNPDLVFIEVSPLNYPIVRILDGPTGAIRATIDAVASDGLRPYCCEQPAVGDLDGDGIAEVVLSARREADGKDVLAAFHLDGVLLWELLIDGIGPSDLILSDLEGDGAPEIIGKSIVVDRFGVLRWRSPFLSTPLERNGENYAEVADLDLDGQREVVAGAVAYRSDGSLLWQHRDPTSPGFVPPLLEPDYHAIAKGGGAVPLVYAIDHPAPADRTDVYALDGASGALLWGPLTLPGVGAPGRGAVADLDGDGMGDLIHLNGEFGAHRAYAISAGGALLWQQDLEQAHCAHGVSVFDLDGDGAVEIVLRTYSAVRILDGPTGWLRASATSYMTCASQSATVGDLDHDGRADIVAPMGEAAGIWSNCGVVVYSNPTWWGARGTWPDVDYHINDATDAGGIPADEPLSWCDHGTWRGQRSLAPRLADATVSFLRASLGSCPDVVLSARVGSAGGKVIPAGAAVSFWDGDPGMGGTLLGTVATTRDLVAGQFEEVSITVANPALGIAALFASVVTAAVECDGANECGAILVPACGGACTASASASAASACAGGPALLDATGSAAAGCSLPAEYRFRQGAVVLRDWSADATASWLLPLSGSYEVDVRCPTDTSCTATAASTVVVDPGVVPGDLGNGLFAVRVGGEVRLLWSVEPLSRSYTLYRSQTKDAWAGPTVEDLPGTSHQLADIPFPPALNFYRAAGANCSGDEGP